MAQIKVNAVGDACPIPVVKTKKVLKEIKEKTTVIVSVDNEIAVQNVTRLANNNNLLVTADKTSEGIFEIAIEVPGPIDKEEECEMEVVKGDTVVVISSDKMGEGNDELGKVLIKGFIFALTQLDKLPETIIFYNGGATIPVEGSVSLEDLRNLEKAGVNIMTCGTCLDYYNLKDKLAVGSITNMYSIVETLAKAGKIIKP